MGGLAGEEVPSTIATLVLPLSFYHAPTAITPKRRQGIGCTKPAALASFGARRVPSMRQLANGAVLAEFLGLLASFIEAKVSAVVVRPLAAGSKCLLTRRLTRTSPLAKGEGGSSPAQRLQMSSPSMTILGILLLCPQPMALFVKARNDPLRAAVGT